VKPARLLFAFLAASFAAAAQDMPPNKDPVPSPSELRSARGEDRPQGEAREARTPSPSDLAVERPRLDGDRWTSGLPQAGNAGAGGTAPAPAPSELANPGPAPQFR
jgi:hypothetical protein